MAASPTILFAGGGSGGHIFPNLAVVERLFERRLEVTPRLLVSERNVDREIAEAAGIAWEALPATSLRKTLGGAARFTRGYTESQRAVRRMIRTLESSGGAAALVATGGFVSGPAVAAARACGVPVALVSLDAKAGRANRLMARKADVVFAALHGGGLKDRNRRDADVVGFPLRYTAVSHLDASSARAGLGLDATKQTLLVFAGSQGATTINEAMAEWMTRTGVARKFEGWQVLHYAGPGRDDVDTLREAYAEAGVSAVVEPFGHRMGLAWASADLALTRAGAGTVAEAWSNAVPTLFLPYPYHKDQHQRLNALPLSNAGGAVLLRDRIERDANVSEISGPVLELMHNGNQREAMSGVLRDRPMGDGAARIADWCEMRLS
ncbi:MAG: glycosyltransferase [Planctomycetota bacterium]